MEHVFGNAPAKNIGCDCCKCRIEKLKEQLKEANEVINHLSYHTDTQSYLEKYKGRE